MNAWADVKTVVMHQNQNLLLLLSVWSVEAAALSWWSGHAHFSVGILKYLQCLSTHFQFFLFCSKWRGEPIAEIDDIFLGMAAILFFSIKQSAPKPLMITFSYIWERCCSTIFIYQSNKLLPVPFEWISLIKVSTICQKGRRTDRKPCLSHRKNPCVVP